MSKTTNKTVNILLENTTKEILEQEAKEQNRSLRGHIKFILEQYTKSEVPYINSQGNNINNNDTNNISNTSKLTTLKDNVPNNISKF